MWKPTSTRGLCAEPGETVDTPYQRHTDTQNNLCSFGPWQWLMLDNNEGPAVMNMVSSLSTSLPAALSVAVTQLEVAHRMMIYESLMNYVGLLVLVFRVDCEMKKLHPVKSICN